MRYIEKAAFVGAGITELSLDEIAFVSGGGEGEVDDDGTIVVTAPRPTYNSDLQVYAVFGGDGGYVTYGRTCTGFLGFGGCSFSVSGGGTYQVNGGGLQWGNQGFTYSEPTRTYTPNAD